MKTAAAASASDCSAAAQTVPVPTGTAPVNVAALTPAQFAALTPVAVVGGVSINSPPVVSFSLADGPTTNNPIIGWGMTNQGATATLPSQAWLRFSLAKLVPGTNGSPSKWVNYIVTTVPVYKSATDKTIVPAALRTPTTDSEGTLVDNKNGTYTYTFARDIRTLAADFSTATGFADLGDLTYDPNQTHRLTIQISGNARGTGTNTADGTNSGVAAVALANPLNVVYDFIPATGKKVAATDFQREVVAVAVCNECHDKLTVHGSRNETQYCVVCHTDQLKFGKTNAVSVPDPVSKVPKFNAATFKETATVDPVTGFTSYRYTPTMSIADGVTLGNFPVMVHRIHNGGSLVKENYDLANLVFDNKGFSMLGNGQRMCTKCHDNTQAAQADNHFNRPSRVACGGCHDGIDFATGKGSTLADKAAFASAKTSAGTGTGTVSTAVLATTGHGGGVVPGQTTDANCNLCHGPAEIKVYHRTENVTKHNPTITPGLVSFTYEIKSASVDAVSNDLSIEFRINSATADANGVLGAYSPVTLNAAAAGMADRTPPPGVVPLTGFTGGPSFLLAWAQPQDNIQVPIDYNNLGQKQAQARSVSLASLLDTKLVSTVGSLSARSPDGYYTATVKGSGTTAFPVGAKLRTVGMQAYFTQITAPGSPTAGIGRHALSVVKAIDSTARRIVVDQNKCSNCHEWFEGHGGNRVANTEICVMCHVPGLATSGRGIGDATIKTWTWTADVGKLVTEWKSIFGFDQQATNAALKLPVVTNNFKDMIHGIHSGRERVAPFVVARDSTSRNVIDLLDFRRMDFPGKLSKCETCHIPGTYTNVPATALASTYESIDAAYALAITGGTATPALAKTALNTANNDDKVVSPYAAACISCHDSTSAQSHVTTQGGMNMVSRATFRSNLATPGGGEACATCHGTGKPEDVAVIHKK